MRCGHTTSEMRRRTRPPSSRLLFEGCPPTAVVAAHLFARSEVTLAGAQRLTLALLAHRRVASLLLCSPQRAAAHPAPAHCSALHPCVLRCSALHIRRAAPLCIPGTPLRCASGAPLRAAPLARRAALHTRRAAPLCSAWCAGPLCSARRRDRPAALLHHRFGRAAARARLLPLARLGRAQRARTVRRRQCRRCRPLRRRRPPSGGALTPPHWRERGMRAR